MSTAEQEEERTGCQAVSVVLHDASQNTIETKKKTRTDEDSRPGFRLRMHHLETQM